MPEHDTKPDAKLIAPDLQRLIAGGVAGAVSRTAVAPLVRTKILFQVQGLSAKGSTPRYTSVWRSLCDMYQRDGLLGLYRGNGANVLRIVPNSAIQFAAYDRYKNLLGDDITPLHRLAAGSLAGATSQIITYPLDFIRARITVDMRGEYTGIFSGLRQIVVKEGPLRLYQGLVPSLIGICPYVGVDFMIYEELRARLPQTEDGKPTALSKLFAGGTAGVCGQTLVYPLDTIRRTLQVQHMKVHDPSQLYTGMLDCGVRIAKRDGFRALYRGMWPNILKVGPALAISFFTFETVKDYLDDL